MNSVRSLNMRLLSSLCAALLAGMSVGRAQISPGELSAAHAALDGVAHCTQCHSIGKEIANEKCFSCHTEIKQRIDARTGYHGTIGSKLCAECHKEHHGKVFKIPRLLIMPQSDIHWSVNTSGLNVRNATRVRNSHARAPIWACSRTVSPVTRMFTGDNLREVCAPGVTGWTNGNRCSTSLMSGQNIL